MAPEKVVPYFGTVEKPECHLLYNVTTMASTWHTVATKDVSLLRRQLDIISELPRDYVFQNYLRCHDDIGWGLDYEYLENFGIQEVPHKKYLNDFLTGKYPDSFARGELYNDDPRLGDARLCGTTASLCGIERFGFEGNQEGVDRAVRYDITLHAFMFSQSGIPVIYSGDEIGQVNDYSYKDDPEKSDDSRYLHRGKFDWKLAENRHDPATVQGKLFPMLDKLEHIRSSHVYSTAMCQFIPLTPGIIPFLPLYVRMMKKNLSESTISAKMIKLHGSMKKMVCTQILSPDVRWKPKVCRFLHSDAIGCAEINNNF